MSAFSEEKFRNSRKAAPALKNVRSIDLVAKVYVNNLGSSSSNRFSQVLQSINSQIKLDSSKLPTSISKDDNLDIRNTASSSSLKPVLSNYTDTNFSGLKRVNSFGDNNKRLKQKLKGDSDDGHPTTLQSYFKLAQKEYLQSTAENQRRQNFTPLSSNGGRSSSSNANQNDNPSSRNPIHLHKLSIENNIPKLSKNEENQSNQNRSETTSTQSLSDEFGFPEPQIFPTVIGPRKHNLMMQQKAQLQKYDNCFNNQKNNETHIQEEEDDDDEAIAAATAASKLELAQPTADFLTNKNNNQQLNVIQMFEDNENELSAININNIQNTEQVDDTEETKIKIPKKDLLTILDELELQDSQTHPTLRVNLPYPQLTSHDSNQIKRSQSTNWMSSGKWGVRKPTAISQKGIKTFNIGSSSSHYAQENSKPVVAARLIGTAGDFKNYDNTTTTTNNYNKINNVPKMMMRFGMTSSGHFFGNNSEKFTTTSDSNKNSSQANEMHNHQHHNYINQKQTSASGASSSTNLGVMSSNQQYLQEIMDLKKRLKKQTFGLRPLQF